MTYVPLLSDRDWAAFEEVSHIHDRAKFLAILSNIVAREVAAVVDQSIRLGKSASFRAESRWEPSSHQLRRGHALLLKEFRQPHNVTVAQFAALAGKSRQQVYKDVGARRLLALSVGARGQRIPDWQFDEIKKKLTQSLLEKAKDVDAWTLYYALSQPNRDFSGKPPIEVVTPRNLERTIGTILSQLGFHD